MPLLPARVREVSEPSVIKGSERGDTLIEILISIAILGIAVTALLGALVTTITSASEHRSLASLDSVLRSYAEQLKYDVELQTSGSWFTQCASWTNTSYATHTIVAPANQPAGYSVEISEMKYWNSVTSNFDSNCGANDQTGFQLATLQGRAPNGVTASLELGLRTP